MQKVQELLGVLDTLQVRERECSHAWGIGLDVDGLAHSQFKMRSCHCMYTLCLGYPPTSLFNVQSADVEKFYGDHKCEDEVDKMIDVNAKAAFAFACEAITMFQGQAIDDNEGRNILSNGIQMR